MTGKNKRIVFFKRLLIWLFYLFSGFVLYSQEANLFPFLITFSRIIYPLSIFWLQIRIKKRSNLFSIDSSMTTSQLWFSILPVLASSLTVIFTILNSFFFILERLLNY